MLRCGRRLRRWRGLAGKGLSSLAQSLGERMTLLLGLLIGAGLSSFGVSLRREVCGAVARHAGAFEFALHSLSIGRLRRTLCDVGGNSLPFERAGGGVFRR